MPSRDERAGCRAPRRRRGIAVRAAAACAILLAAPACGHGGGGSPDGAHDLVLASGKIWTGAGETLDNGWIAIRGDRIAAVGRGEAPPAARTIDLQGRLVVPGFNDTHVHFASAGRLLLGANLLDASDDEAFAGEIRAAAERLPEGSWITGGDWGAYEAWEAGSEGAGEGTYAAPSYRPRRGLIDPFTSSHPVLVRRFDRKMGLANARALEILGLVSPDGILEGEILERALERIPEPSRERRMAEARRALRECRRWGVTSIQDMSPTDQVDLYRRLRDEGELTARIHFSPSRLSEVAAMIERGWTVGAGDEWLRFGTVKSHVDGIMGARTARFFEPYDDNPPGKEGWRGGWREFSKDLEGFERRLVEADAAGIQLRVHAIGDEANALLLGMVERLEEAHGGRDRRFRLVHAQVIRREDFPRFQGLGIIAEVQPYHCIDDMRWMEERIGRERCEGAYAFRTLADSGALLAFGSDWPGTHASYYPVNPLLGIYAAVTRQTLEGRPGDGWFPVERVGLEEALGAYTRAGAYATFEEEIKGTLEKGMLADLAVLDTDLFQTPPEAWLEARVDLTVVGGGIVHDREAAAGRAR